MTHSLSHGTPHMLAWEGLGRVPVLSFPSCTRDGRASSFWPGDARVSRPIVPWLRDEPRKVLPGNAASVALSWVQGNLSDLEPSPN